MKVSSWLIRRGGRPHAPIVTQKKERPCNEDLARMRGVITCSSEVRRRSVGVCTFLGRAVDPAGIGPQEVARAAVRLSAVTKAKCLVTG